MSACLTLIFIDWHLVTSLGVSQRQILIPCIAIDHIQQDLAGLITAEILTEELDDLIPMVRAHAGRMRRDDDIRQAPERACRVQGLAFKDVEDSAAQSAVPQRSYKSRLIDNLSTRNINNDRAG